MRNKNEEGTSIAEMYVRIKALRETRKLSQEELAKKVGYSDRSTVAKVEAGKVDLTQSKILAFAKALGTTTRYLMDGIQDIPHYDNVFPLETQKVPMLGTIACGEPIYAEQEEGEYITAEGDVKADFCLRCKGDSMTGARIHDGDVVFIKKQDAVNNGEIAAIVIEDDATLKRVYYYQELNLLILKAENPHFEDLIYSGAELDQIKIIGKAIAFQSKLH